MTGFRAMSGFELRLVLVGWGAIGQRLAGLLAQRGAAVRIVGVAVQDASLPRKGLPEGAALIDSPQALAPLRADLVIEAAGRASVVPWASAALRLGVDVAVSSTSAFAQEGVLDDLVALARQHRARVIVPPGALGGIDALAAAGRLPLSSVRHEVVKPPAAWAGTGAEALCDLAALTAPCTFYEGPARAATQGFPQNANVVAISALAGIGLDRTTVALVADPGARLNRHRIVASGDFGRMEITLENRPLADNPKSSEMTALSLLRLVENRINPLVI